MAAGTCSFLLNMFSLHHIMAVGKILQSINIKFAILCQFKLLFSFCKCKLVQWIFQACDILDIILFKTGVFVQSLKWLYLSNLSYEFKINWPNNHFCVGLFLKNKKALVLNVTFHTLNKLKVWVLESDPSQEKSQLEQQRSKQKTTFGLACYFISVPQDSKDILEIQAAEYRNPGCRLLQWCWTNSHQSQPIGHSKGPEEL